MKRKAKVLCPNPDLYPDWTVTHQFRYNHRDIFPGTEVSIEGERGRFLFIKHVSRANGIEWLDFFGPGDTKHSTGVIRSFRPDRIRTVHRKNKTRANA